MILRTRSHNILSYYIFVDSAVTFTFFFLFSDSGRKFGGYRIVPRACKDDHHSFKNDVSTITTTTTGTGTGVCMFNYECTQMGGSVVGSCVDVFLFGACCRLPAGVKVPTAIEHSASTAAAATTTTPGPHFNELPPLTFQQPVADTILLHRNGSAVQNTYRPDDLFGNFTAMIQANRDRFPPAADMTEVMQQYNTEGGYHQQLHQQRPSPFAGNNKITSKVDYGDAATIKLQMSQSLSSSSSSPVSKSTDSLPNFRKTTPSATTLQATTSKQGYGGVHHNHHRPSAADDYYDNMVLIPTLTVNDPNVKENNSIHHILSILNYTPPAPDRNHMDSMDTSPSYAIYQSTGPPPTSPPALYTWGSIDGDSKSPGYGASTFPVTRPSSTIHSSTSAQQHYDRPTGYYGSTPSTTTTTSSHHLPGPHFHVLSSTTTAKPSEPVAPTVIVLSPANDSKYPNKYTTPSSNLYTSGSSSYRPQPASHVKPSQSIIVTGKPSVSAAYTTTGTYHHPQQQDASFVPVSSTTMADKYYSANYQPTTGSVHTSAKPLVSTNYGYRPSSTTTTTTTTTTGPPPTLNSALHHDAGTNNNVFTTVITSVNHQYHNKYQPTTAVNGGSSSYSTAKPAVNDGGTVAVLSTSAGGYRPSASVDDDYPTPVVTPATQVFITASDVHHLQQHHIQQQLHNHLQHHTSSSSYPVTGVQGSTTTADDDVAAVPFNSTDTFAFPPVRDPYVNLTAATQQEKPDVTVVDAVGDYDVDTDSNPQFTADDNLDDKVHLFVEKVVQSLQGNFEDLEKVLLAGDPSSSNVTVGNDDPSGWPVKKPTTATPTSATPTKKPTRPAAVKPTKPIQTSPQPVKWTSTTTYRPTPITPPLDAAPYLEPTTVSRPVKYPTLLTPVQLFQPTTYATDNKRPTKVPVKMTPSTTVVLDTLSVEHDHHTTAEPDYRKSMCTVVVVVT